MDSPWSTTLGVTRSASDLLTLLDDATTIRLARELVERHDVRPSKTLVTLELVSGDETLLSSDVSIVGRGEAGVRSSARLWTRTRGSI